MIIVLVQVEKRTKKLSLKRGTLGDLRSAFNEMCEKDPVFRQRIITHYPTFQTFDGEAGMILEIEPNDPIVSNQKIAVHFASYAAVEEVSDVNTENDNADSWIEATQDSLPGNVTRTGIPRSRQQQDVSFLNSIGVPFTMSAGPSTASSGPISTLNLTSTSVESRTTPSSATTLLTNRLPLQDLNKNTDIPVQTQNYESGKKGTRSKSAIAGNQADSDEDDYSAMATRNRTDNVARLLEFAKDLPRNAPKLKKKSKGKENKSSTADGTTVEKRVMPSRAVKWNASEHRASPVDFLDDISDEETSDRDGPRGLCDPAQNEKQQNKKSRRLPDKPLRPMGNYINKSVSLPTFPEFLKDALINGLVYVSQAHTRAMNDFLVSHLQKETGTMYITDQERVILKQQITSRLEDLNLDVEKLKFYKGLVMQRLSESIRSRTSHIRNRKPRLAAIKAAQIHPVVPLIPESAEQQVNSDEILRQPVLDKQTVKEALKSSKERETYIKLNSVKDAMLTYPYLADAELFVEDFASRVCIATERLKENFNLALLPLASLFERESGPESELQKVQLFKDIEVRFQNEKAENIWPCMRFCYEIRGGVPVDNIPQGQSPGVIILLNDRDLLSVHLIFNGEIILSHKQPEAFLVVALLVGAYFVFDMKYPNPYKKQLRVMELIITKRNPLSRETDVKTFLAKLKQATDFLLQAICKLRKKKLK